MRLIKIAIDSASESGLYKSFAAKGHAGESFNSRPYFQHRGFTSLPKENDLGVVIADNNQVTMIASVDSTSTRPLLSDGGDCAIYADENNYIKISASGDIDVISDSGTITIDNGQGKIVLESNGQVNINDGNLTVDP